MTTKARGAIARTPGAPVSIEDFTIEDPGQDEILVKILASGVCHTDLGVKNGVYGSDGFPFLLGHEGTYSLACTSSNHGIGTISGQ